MKILILFLAMNVLAEDNTKLEKLSAKGHRNGCVRAINEYTKQELVTDKTTKFCEKMYWKVLKEMKQSRRYKIKS